MYFSFTHRNYASFDYRLSVTGKKICAPLPPTTALLFSHQAITPPVTSCWLSHQSRNHHLCLWKSRLRSSRWWMYVAPGSTVQYEYERNDSSIYPKVECVKSTAKIYTICFNVFHRAGAVTSGAPIKHKWRYFLQQWATLETSLMVKSNNKNIFNDSWVEQKYTYYKHS